MRLNSSLVMLKTQLLLHLLSHKLCQNLVRKTAYLVTPIKSRKTGLTGSRLRSYAFAVLTRKEYSKAELIEKLALYAEDRNEVVTLVEELSRENYQSDQRVAEIMLSSQKRKGKGPNQIKMKLKSKRLILP